MEMSKTLALKLEHADMQKAAEKKAADKKAAEEEAAGEGASASTSTTSCGPREMDFISSVYLSPGKNAG